MKAAVILIRAARQSGTPWTAAQRAFTEQLLGVGTTATSTGTTRHFTPDQGGAAAHAVAELFTLAPSYEICAEPIRTSERREDDGHRARVEGKTPPAPSDTSQLGS
jgi:hypothetical protein